MLVVGAGGVFGHIFPPSGRWFDAALQVITIHVYIKNCSEVFDNISPFEKSCPMYLSDVCYRHRNGSLSCVIIPSLSVCVRRNLQS